MSGFRNKQKEQFLSTFSVVSVEAPDNNLPARSKFNFSYFHKQAASQDFDEWTPEQLVKLMEKLKDYSVESLLHWRHMPVGRGRGHVLEIYGKFPKRTDFTAPKHVPVQALWGRFRLESAVRLVGFVLPQELHGSEHQCGARFDCNTFYVVYLDKDHRFYLTEEK